MIKKIVFVAKIIGMVFLLILAHITITYTVEQLELVTITPLTFSNVRDSHIANILAPFPFLVIWGGWLYFIAFLVFHIVIKRLPKKTGLWIPLGLGVAVSMSFFLLWWTIVEVMDPEVLREGLIVYPILGLVLALLHKLFFRVEEPT